MELQDKVLTCADCGVEFVFTTGEQLFFQDRNFRNPPKRCKPCKAKRVATVAPPVHTRFNRGHRTLYKIETHTVCSVCGKATTVPFKPTQGRPVLCRDCYQHRGHSASA